jgi:hypothetical protein
MNDDTKIAVVTRSALHTMKTAPEGAVLLVLLYTCYATLLALRRSGCAQRAGASGRYCGAAAGCFAAGVVAVALATGCPLAQCICGDVPSVLT